MNHTSQRGKLDLTIREARTRSLMLPLSENQWDYRRMKRTISKSAVAVAVILLIGTAVSGCGSSGTGGNPENNQAGSITEASTATTSTSGVTHNNENGESSNPASTATQATTTPGSAPSEVSGLPLLPSAVPATLSFSAGSVSVAFYISRYVNFTVPERVEGHWATRPATVSYRGTA